MLAGGLIVAMLWCLAHFCLWNLRCVFIEYITVSSTYRIITEGCSGWGDSYSRVSSARPIWFVSRFSVWLARSIADVWERRGGGKEWRWVGLLYRYKDREGKGRCNRSEAVWKPCLQAATWIIKIIISSKLLLLSLHNSSSTPRGWCINR